MQIKDTGLTRVQFFVGGPRPPAEGRIRRVTDVPMARLGL
jgi:hypothetical protein